jgi:GNAT superfamily N-acetyltransferase
MSRKTNPSHVEFHPLIPGRWVDFETLFGPRGACAGCWCMWWRLRRSEWTAGKGSGNRKAMQRIVKSGEVPGILAYADGRPVGWCSIGPRENFGALGRSRILKPIDEEPVWSVVCFYVTAPYRRRGITVALLKAAVAYAHARGARIVEGYPVEPKKGSMPDVFAFTGIVSAFRRAGFIEAARRSATRPIMRCPARRGTAKSRGGAPTSRSPRTRTPRSEART